jgi:hypothetical protein
MQYQPRELGLPSGMMGTRELAQPPVPLAEIVDQALHILELDALDDFNRGNGRGGWHSVSGRGFPSQ